MAGTVRARRMVAASVAVLFLVLQALQCAAADEKTFVCDGGATRLRAAAVDDDYCDCADGSDEPHTAACSRGHFVCANAGFVPRRVPSAFVNDGVCDCCDGSDEWAAPGTCNNTCAALAAARRAELHARRDAATAGLALQAAWAERGAADHAHAAARSTALATLLADARAQRQAVADAEQRLGRTLPRSAVVVVRAGEAGAQGSNDTDAGAVLEVREGVHVDIATAEAAVRAAEEAQAQEEEEEKKKKATAGGHENNTTAAVAAREAVVHAWGHVQRAVVHAWHWVLCRAARRDESCRVLEEMEDEDGDSGRRHAAYSEALQAIDEYTRELEDERRTLQTLVELALNDAPCYYVVAQECSEVTMPTFVDVFSCSPISLLSRLFSHVRIALFTATEGCSRRVRSTTCRWHTARLDGGSGRRRAAVPQRRWSLPTATTRGIVRSAPAACSLSAALPTRSSRCRSPPSAPLRASLPRRVHAPRSTLPTTPLSLSSCLLLLLLKTDFSSSPSLSFHHISLLFLKHQHHPHPFVQFVFR